MPILPNFLVCSVISYHMIILKYDLQVQQLIQDAIDPDRLCRMFPGWGAWL